MAPDEDGPAPPAVQDEDLAPPGGAEPSPEERRLAGSPHAVAANAALLALTRAARSFTLYDPANKVVRALIARLPRPLPGGPRRLRPARARRPPLRARPRPRGRLPRAGPRALARLPPLPRRRAPDRLRRPARPGRSCCASSRSSRSATPACGSRRTTSSPSCARRASTASRSPPSRASSPRRSRRSPRSATCSAAPRERYDPPAQWDLPLPAVPGGRARCATGRWRRSCWRGCARRRPRRRCRGTRCARWRELLQAPGRPGPRGRARLRPRGAGVPARRAAGATCSSSSAASCATRSPSTPEAAAAFLELVPRRAHARGPRGGAPPDATELPPPLAGAPRRRPRRRRSTASIDLLAEEGDGPAGAPPAPARRARLPARAGGARRPPARRRAGTPAVALLRLLADVDPAGRAARRGRGLGGGRRRAAARGAPAAERRRLHPRDGARAPPPRGVAARAGAARRPPRDGGPGRGRASSPPCGPTWRSTRPRSPPPRPRRRARPSPRPQARSALALFGAWLDPKAGGLLGRLVKMHAPPAAPARGPRRAARPRRGRRRRRCSSSSPPTARPSVARDAEAALDARARGPGGRRG